MPSAHWTTYPVPFEKFEMHEWVEQNPAPPFPLPQAGVNESSAISASTEILLFTVFLSG